MKKYLSLFGFIVLLDLITKQLALGLCPSMIAINRGISWSLITPATPYGFAALTTFIALFVLLFMGYTWKRYKENLSILPEVLICAGAFANNLIDRPWHGGVIDFISIGFCNYNWPLFNIADIAIVVGVILVFIREVYKK